MPPGIVIIAVGAFVAGIVIVKTIAETILRLRDQNRHASNPAMSSVSDERIARIEAAVEAIAIEVERISEGQRFTTKLLSEQNQPVQALPPKRGTFDTPH